MCCIGSQDPGPRGCSLLLQVQVCQHVIQASYMKKSTFVFVSQCEKVLHWLADTEVDSFIVLFSTEVDVVVDVEVHVVAVNLTHACSMLSNAVMAVLSTE